MNKRNKLLERQIRKHFNSTDEIPKELEAFLDDINRTYESFDDDINLLQNSIEISSSELRAAFQKQKEDTENQKEVIRKIKEVIAAIQPSANNLVDKIQEEDTTQLFDSLIELIEDRKKNEENILRLSLAVEQNPASIVITDTKGNIEYVNPKFCDLTGYSKEEIIGKNPSILKSGYTSPEAYKNLWKTILTGNEWQGEFLNKKKNGDLYWEYAFISPVKNTSGKTINFIAIKEDISERKKTEETLQNERTLFRTIIDLIPDAVYVKDINGKKLLANPTDVKFSGRKSESEIIGLTDFELYSTEQAQDSLNEDLQVLNSGKPILNHEGYLITENNELRSLLVSKVPLYDIQGKITGLVGVTHDITERKISENQLKLAHKSIADILNAAIHTSIIASDVQGIITVFSAGAENLIGYKAKEMIGIQTPAIFHIEEEMVQRSKELTEEFGRPIEGFEVFVAKARQGKHDERTWTYKRKDGSTILVNLVVTAIFDINNEITGFLGIANDITESKKAEEELKHLSTRLALATSAGEIGVWDYDLINDKLLWDDQMYNLYGITGDKFNKAFDDWRSAVHPDDEKRVEAEIQLAIQNIKEFNTEFKIIWPDNSVHNIRAMAAIVQDSEGKTIRMIGTNWDITEQKMNEAVLLKARQEAELANKAKSEFLANVSHEIRTPMNAIIGFAEILLDKIVEPNYREYLSTILSSGRTLLSLINDILDLSKIEAGKLEFELEPVHYTSLIKGIEQVFAPKIEKKNLSFEVILSPDSPNYIFTDEVRLHQILFNLVGNAIKFTDKGFIRLESTVEKTEIPDTVNLKIEIEDTGIGIPHDQIQKIFDAFTQQSGQNTRKYEGTGLGLAITKRLVEKMNGIISLTSTVGKGSTFTIEFKNVQLAEINRETDKAVENEDYQIAFSPASIMIVDDIYFNIQVVKSMLDSFDFTFIEANNAEEAIEILETEKPDLILMDIRMTGMSGISATEIIKTKMKIHVPVIAFTASAMQNQMARINELFNGYLHKPISKKTLLNTLKQHLKYKPNNAPFLQQQAIQDTKIKDTCLVNAPEMMQKLEETIYPHWKEISNSLVIFEIEEFANSLYSLSSQHNCLVLTNFSKKLKENIQTFNVELIESSMSEFEELYFNLIESTR